METDLRQWAEEGATEDLVAAGDQCPECGERRMDALGWAPDGEAVRCASCGAVYTPGGAP